MNRVKKKIWGAIAAAAVVMGMGLAAAPAANAAPQDYCGSGNTCAWRDHTYKTNGSASSLIWFSQCVHDYYVLPYSGTSIYNTRPISVYNNGNYDSVYVYINPGYAVGSGASSKWQRILGKKTGDGNVTNNEGYIAGFQPISSARFETVSTSCRN